VKIADSGGYIEVRVNEVTVLNLTGIDTQNTANAATAQFVVGPGWWGADGVKPHFGNFDFDDPFAWDDDATDPENTVVDFVGDKGAYWLPPVSDTATSEFDITPSAPAYGVLDEVPPSGTDYLATAATTARTIVGRRGVAGQYLRRHRLSAGHLFQEGRKRLDTVPRGPGERRRRDLRARGQSLDRICLWAAWSEDDRPCDRGAVGE
jgi:hypothetical protein